MPKKKTQSIDISNYTPEQYLEHILTQSLRKQRHLIDFYHEKLRTVDPQYIPTWDEFRQVTEWEIRKKLGKFEREFKSQAKKTDETAIRKFLDEKRAEADAEGYLEGGVKVEDYEQWAEEVIKKLPKAWRLTPAEKPKAKKTPGEPKKRKVKEEQKKEIPVIEIEESKVEEAPAEAPVVGMGKYALFKSDLERLQNGNKFFNDQIINNYGALLNARVNSEREHAYIFNTFLYSTIKSNGQLTDKQIRKLQESYHSVQTHAKFLLIPCNLEQQKHWRLIAIDRESKVAYLIDSQFDPRFREKDIEDVQQVVSAMKRWLDNPEAYRVKIAGVPQQEDDHNCGPAVCYNMKILSQTGKTSRLKYDFNRQGALSIRRQIEFEIMDEDILEERESQNAQGEINEPPPIPAEPEAQTETEPEPEEEEKVEAIEEEPPAAQGREPEEQKRRPPPARRREREFTLQKVVDPKGIQSVQFMNPKIKSMFSQQYYDKLVEKGIDKLKVNPPANIYRRPTVFHGVKAGIRLAQGGKRQYDHPDSISGPQARKLALSGMLNYNSGIGMLNAGLGKLFKAGATESEYKQNRREVMRTATTNFKQHIQYDKLGKRLRHTGDSFHGQNNIFPHLTMKKRPWD